MRRIATAALLATALAGCTGTKLVQRDGCWIKRTEKIFRHVEEELGPCARTSSPWAEDRLTRLIQECVSREDYRWQTRAIAAWNRGEPWPPQASEQNVLSACMTDSTRALMTENDALKRRLETMNDRVTEVAKERDAVAKDRDAVRARFDDDRKRLFESQEKLAGYLGEAAKKAQQPATATATATSDGRASNESKASERVAPVAVVSPPMVVTAPAPTVVTMPAPTVVAAPASVVKASQDKAKPTAQPNGSRKPATSAPTDCPPAPPAAQAGAPATEDLEAKALADELMKAGTGSSATAQVKSPTPAPAPAPASAAPAPAPAPAPEARAANSAAP
jgi:hypothetical protein